MNAKQIHALRQSLNENRETFGRRVGVSGRTVEGWEQGHRRPGPAARVLLGRLAEEKTKAKRQKGSA